MAKDEAKLESDDELFEADLYRDESSDEAAGGSDDDDGGAASGRPPARGNGRAGGGKTRDFQTGMVLTTPRIIQMSVAQLWEDMDSGDIDLEPDYQRNVVWTEEKQSNLISSLLSHFYIPPILLSAHPNSSTGHQYTCIDGKQRLSSIKLFMQNQIPVADASKTKFYYSGRGHSKRALPGDVAKRFRRESVPVVIYENLTDAQEREMFQRVQMGVTLSPAEKLSALRTPWTICFDQLAKRYMDSSRPGENLCHIVRTSRSNDWLFMGQIAMTILNEDKQPYLAHFQQVKNFVEKEAPPTSSQKKDIFDALNRLLVLSNDPEHNTPLIRQEIGHQTKQQLSPVEFVHIAFMCWRHPTASFAELSEWSAKLRVGVHTRFPGQVRYNTPCAMLLRKKIESFRPTGQGGEGALHPRPQKRRYEDDDEDYHPSRDSTRRNRPAASNDASTSTAAATTTTSGTRGRTSFYSGAGASGSGSGQQRPVGEENPRPTARPIAAAGTVARAVASASPRVSSQHSSVDRPNRHALFRGSSSPEEGAVDGGGGLAVPAPAPAAERIATALQPPTTGTTTGNVCALSARGAFPASRRITPQNPFH